MKKKYKVKIIKKKIIYEKNPLKIFNQICRLKKNTLLLESSKTKNKKKIESIIIVDSAIRITLKKSIIYIKYFSKNGKNLINRFVKCLSKNIKFKKKKNVFKIFFLKENKFISLDEDKRLKETSFLKIFKIIINNFDYPKKNPQSIFFGGLFSYDFIKYYENSIKFKKKQKCPDFCFYVAETMIFFNHKNKKCIIQSTIFKKNKIEKIRLKKKILKIKKLMVLKNFQKYEKKNVKNISITNNCDKKKFSELVKKSKKYIKKGKIFQIVLSRKFFISCYNPLYAYFLLKKSNPSPYMFFMNDEKFTLFGSSPEIFLKYNSKNRKIEIHPIAGTRKRGTFINGSINIDLDNKIELEMRTNKKELSEHIMLVDLARNDLAKICVPGSRYVKYFKKVHKYSHVMHLVSVVTGKLKKDLDAFHAYYACMNMGTLTGAPKIKAMQIISKLEKEERGVYGGSIGYFNGSGALNTCIIIRSAYIKKNIATVQSGAGIVLESIPEEETKETWNKACAVLQSIYLSQKNKNIIIKKFKEK
ncbi:anthranilate synthase component 1 [Buchnera aphidicola]|uniref:anthranilate synthase component 1 n=1 Tax=Buchnera aphidicola TaxID=9 RepID=UPI0030EE725C